MSVASPLYPGKVFGMNQDATHHAVVAGASSPVPVHMVDVLPCTVAGFQGMLSFSQQKSFEISILGLSS